MTIKWVDGAWWPLDAGLWTLLFGTIMPAVFALLVLLPFFALAAFAFWKKYWVAVPGEVIRLENTHTRVWNESKNALKVRYGYRIGAVQYTGVETIPIDVSYDAEDSLVATIRANFPVGKKLNVYVPARAPSLSSVSRDVPQLKRVALAAVSITPAAVVCHFIANIYFGSHR